MKEQTDRDYETKLVIDETYLGKSDGGQYGGIILASTNRKIVCINTMLSRLNQCFEELLPDIRKALFPRK